MSEPLVDSMAAYDLDLPERLAAMKVVKALENLTDAERALVLQWAYDHHVATSDLTRAHADLRSAMSEPLDLEPIRTRDAQYTHELMSGGLIWERRVLLAEVERLRGLIAAVEALFAGGPDTVCRTTWIDNPLMPGCSAASIECVEVPMADLRAALAESVQP